MGKVYLVGAGPGDAGLITIKGLEKLKKCDAVVYDRLATEELLDYVKSDCEKIYVGKEATKHYKNQDEINDILVECAKKYDMVVRLKGGDSFVFGRGGEEIEALMVEDIPYEVIPGVTSAVAVPEVAGIPVTHRGVSRSFHVITGHTKTSVGSPEYDYETLTKLEGTIVFLMGLSNLSEIRKSFLRAGKSGNTPVAVISNGTLDTQRTVRGTLKNILQKVENVKLVSPAIIVIGETAAYSYVYNWSKLENQVNIQDLQNTSELENSEIDNGDIRNGKIENNEIENSKTEYEIEGKRVGITATDLLWKRLKNRFEKIGMKPISVCNMKVVPTEYMKELENELHNLNVYQWILFTSQNAVQLFFEKINQEDIDIRNLGRLKFAVLGSGTAEKLRSYGIKADFLPSRYTVSVMSEEFAKIIKNGERVLVPRAVQGSRDLDNILDKYNIDYKDIPIYDVSGRMTQKIKYLEDLDYLVFVSASGVTAFFEELRKERLSLPKGIKLACIGNITRQRLLQEYGEADVVATVNDVNGLIDAIKIQR